jgi:hypothetical protein
MNDDIILLKQLEMLKEEHRVLDDELQELTGGWQDEMRLARLKKKKLQLRDQIAELEALIYPDVPA